MRAPVFNRELVGKMGSLVEAALFTENSSNEEINLLLYVKEFIRARRRCLAREDTEKIMINLREKEKLINDIIDVYSLNMWIRGSWKNEKESLDKKEEEILLERIEEKLRN